MNVEDARKIREEAMENYERLADLIYLPKVEREIKEAAEKGHSNVEVRLGGGFMQDEPVPDKKVVDEILRTLEIRGFEAKDEFTGEDDRTGMLEYHAKQHGRVIKISW